MSIVQKLTEGLVQRDLSKDGAALMAKWSETGLLEGITDERSRASMARLLENQAKQLLRESTTMAGGDVEGFAAVAFPIVRRVFGSLIANELVSVQPMSLPSGLIFFLDFKFNSTRLGVESGESLFGGNRLASQITGGVVLTGDSAEDSFYNLNNGYSSPTGSVASCTFTVLASGTYGSDATLDSYCRFDPDFTSGTTKVCVFTMPITDLETGGQKLNRSNLVGVTFTPASGSLARRLTAKCDSAGAAATGDLYTHLRFVVYSDSLASTALDDMTTAAITFPLNDTFTSGNANGSIKGTTPWGLENNANIPEIDIKIDSVSVEAKTKKLKAKWTPELGQDMNAYHNLDAEVELTSILSEQIGLELDQEILEDLIKGATAATYYWSRRPGRFVNRTTGADISTSANESLMGADFTGNVSMWYETLAETINDVSAQIHRKTLRGGANFVVCSPEVANLLEFTSGFRANVVHDDGKGTIGTVKVGNLSKKWDVYVDPYFPRNVVLVGRKGSSFLESGYVYSPYVPLQQSPTVVGVEDFVPRKSVMTRYGKRMVRPDLYGIVIVKDLLG